MANGTTTTKGGSLDNSNPSLGLAFDGSGLELTCDCGESQVANEALRGMVIKCTSCDAPLEVPLDDDDMMMEAPTAPAAQTPEPVPAPTAPASASTVRPGRTFRGIGLAFGLVLAVFIVYVAVAQLDGLFRLVVTPLAVLAGIACVVSGYRAGAKVDVSTARAGVARGADD